MKRAVGRRPSWSGKTAGDPPRAVDAARRPAAGFSLLELMVVMSVTVLLTGLLLPALIKVRENAHRVICSSNLRQVGLATVMYADDHNGGLPPSKYGEKDGNRQELMSAHGGERVDDWQGFGWLHAKGYCKAPEIFYCPSHTGQHPYERYERYWRSPGLVRIYTNYHYAGPRDWITHDLRRLGGATIVLATDGLRTLRDFNHKCGMNVLQSDNSVLWSDSMCREVVKQIPDDDEEPQAPDQKRRYDRIWELLSELE
ncbi:MAG: type II secretion system protein [Planctomycetota bacterium]